MAMEIAKYLQVSLLGELVAELLGRKYGRVQHLARPFPSPIKITTRKGAPVISIDDTIWVEHWHDLEDEVLPQVFGFNRVGIDQEIKRSFHHPRAHRLAWMHPGSQYHALPFLHVFRILLRRDGEHFALVASQRLGQRLPLDIMLLDWVSHDGIELLNQLSVGVRIAVRKIHIIVFIFKLVRERHRVQSSEAFRAIFSDAIWVISYLCSSSVPSDILLLRVLLRVDEHLHSFIVQGVRLAKIQHAEANCVVALGVRNSEEKPLSVAAGIHVILKGQIIVIIADFQSSGKVAGFESTLEDQGFVKAIPLHVEWLDSLQVHQRLLARLLPIRGL